MKILIIFILIIIIFILRNLINKTEKYDGRISVSNYYDCGDICSKTIGCAGFAYNDNNKCYISKTPINPLPLPALYSNEYKTTNTYCNKFMPIQTDFSISTDMFAENRMYTCYKDRNNFLGDFFFNNNNIIDLKDKNRSYLKAEPYELKRLNWNDITDKYDINSDTTYTNRTVEYISDKDNEYLGAYLNPSICYSNTSINKCKKICNNRKDCVGFEYKTKFKDDENLCCPKAVIKTVKPRTDKSGVFYKKEIKTLPTIDYLNKDDFLDK